MLARTLAVSELQAKFRPLFSHQSAAVIWGLPLLSDRDERVHLITPSTAPGRSSRVVERHVFDVPKSQIVCIEGVRFTHLDRTMIDLMRFAPMETAIAATDAGMRRQFGPCRQGLTPETSAWRADHARRLELCAGQRGVRRARRVLEFADPRADSPAESVSRLQLARLQVPVDIQVRVVGPSGDVYWVDFEFVGQRMFGEVDGVMKYADPAMRGGRSAEQVVIGEKRREDEIRGVTQFSMVRWEPGHTATARALGLRLQAYGLQVPRLESGRFLS